MGSLFANWLDKSAALRLVGGLLRLRSGFDDRQRR
jgi:hypothetical protein